MNGILQKAPLLRQKELRPQILPQEALLMSTKNDIIVCPVDTFIDIFADVLAYAFAAAHDVLPDDQHEIVNKIFDLVVQSIADAMEEQKEVD